MRFFPSDYDDEEFDDSSDGFQGDLDFLVSEFESQNREQFSARELIELFRHYTNSNGEHNPFKLDQYAKMVIELGIQTFPYIPVFTLHMVEWLLHEHKYKKAHKYLDQALSYNPLDPTLVLMKGILFGHEGARKLAFDSVHQAISMVGDDEGLYEDFLDMVLHFEQFDLAEPIAQKALEYDSEIIPILEKYINRTEDTHIIRMLIPAVEAQIEKDPYMAEAWYLLGLAFHGMDEFEKAIGAFDYAVTINDNFADAWLGLIEAKYENEEYEGVVQDYQELVKKFPQKSMEPIEGLYAWSLHETGNSLKSREVYKQILKKFPTDAECWYSLGLTYHHEEQYQVALPYLEKAYQLDPSEADYGIVLASAYFGLNLTDKWKRLYEELGESFPFESELWLDWGVALYEIGESGEALDITETGLENNPQNIQLLYRLAALFYLTGNKDMGLMVLEKALEIDPTEYQGIFTFAPELKNSIKIRTLIGKFKFNSDQ
jgi:tetratricopeptide (TPR) repeat protein